MSTTKIHVILDDREHKLKTIFDTKSDTISYESKRLDIADIIVSSEVAIERKEGSDFISSIMDNRLFEQILRLKDTYINPILILEGLNDKVIERTGMRLSSVYGALSMVLYKLGISVIPTRNVEDTAIVIERIAYREQVKDDMPILARNCPKTMSNKERRYYIIEGLVDIGPKKAKALIDKFKTPYKVLKVIKETEIIYTRNGTPKGISGVLAELKGFGWKFVEKNKKILFGSKSNKLDTSSQVSEILEV